MYRNFHTQSRAKKFASGNQEKGKVLAGMLPVVRDSELFSRLAFSLRLDLFDRFFKVAHHHVRFRGVLCSFFGGRELCKVFVQHK
jgi:hypothetical protein